MMTRITRVLRRTLAPLIRKSPLNETPRDRSGGGTSSKAGVSKFTTVEVRKSRAISFLTARSELLVCSQPGY